jgi:hypothetical protein
MPFDVANTFLRAAGGVTIGKQLPLSKRAVRAGCYASGAHNVTEFMWGSFFQMTMPRIALQDKGVLCIVTASHVFRIARLQAEGVDYSN